MPKTHQMSSLPEYIVWRGMKQRCYDPNFNRYADYGGRGIGICPEWYWSFEQFYADMGPRPPGMPLERIDNDKDYSPDNCIWATHSQQARNKRDNTLITFEGDTRTLTEWAEVVGLKVNTVIMRRKRGWTDYQALNLEWPPEHRRDQRRADRSTPINRAKQGHRPAAIIVTYNDKTYTLPELAEETGINYDVLFRRHQLGWTVERMVAREVAPYQGKQFEYNGRMTNLATLAREAGLTKETVWQRVNVRGWTLEEALTPIDGRSIGVSRKERLTVIHAGINKSLAQACLDAGISYTTLIQRKQRKGLTPQQAFDSFL